MSKFCKMRQSNAHVFISKGSFFLSQIYVPCLIRSHSDGLKKQLDFDSGWSVTEKKNSNYYYKQHLSLVRL